MILEPTILSNCYLIRLEPHLDSRGYFSRTYCQEDFANKGLNTTWPQRNVSFNKIAGTVRGLHFQISPASEIKLIHCIRGSIFDVVLDIDKGSKSFGTWVTFNLTAGDNLQIYIGAGLAHGFQTLQDETEVEYSHSVAYSPEYSIGVNALDQGLSIPWPRPITLISEKDLTLPTLESYERSLN
jgi:dTDP-4-dehydrorhamnose 3,5-epimerase